MREEGPLIEEFGHQWSGLRSTKLGEIPIPLPRGARSDFKDIFKFWEGEDQEGIAAWKDSRWTRVAH